MNICRAVDTIAYRSPVDGASVREAAAAVRRRIAEAFAAYRENRAVARAAAMPLDARTLRDIGFTPEGIRVCALAERNEAGFGLESGS